MRAFATGLQHPRWLHVLPNGDVLVAESNAPPKADDQGGIRRWIMGLVMKCVRAPAVAEREPHHAAARCGRRRRGRTRSVLLDRLNSPFGMVLVDGRLYVANADAIVSVPYATVSRASMTRRPR